MTSCNIPYFAKINEIALILAILIILPGLTYSSPFLPNVFPLNNDLSLNEDAKLNNVANWPYLNNYNSVTEICDNSIDDDGDGLIDCDDPDCQDIIVTPTENCANNGIDLSISGGTTPYSYTWSDMPSSDGHWTFENTTDDVSGNGNHQNTGASIGTPSYSTDAVEGQSSLSLNGSTYVRYSMDAAFMEIAFTEWMISTWIKPTSLSGIQTIIDEGGSVNGISVRLNGATLEFAARDNSVQVNAGTHTIPNDGAWHHVAAVYANDSLTLFLDGVKGTPAYTGYVNGEISNHSGNGGIGFYDNGSAFGGGSGNYYTGLMDDFKYFFNQSMTADQIADLATNNGSRNNLSTGTYYVTVVDSDGGCATVVSQLVDGFCIEICDNNIDDDGDGLIDCADPDCSPSGYADLVTSQTGVINPNNALNAADGAYAEVYDPTDVITLDLTDEIPAGYIYNITWRRKSTYTNTEIADIVVEESSDGINFTTNPTLASTSERINFINTNIIANVNTRYIRLSEQTGTDDDFDLDAVSYTINCGTPATICDSCTGANLFANPGFESGSFIGADEFITGVNSDNLGSNWSAPSGLDGWVHGPLYWVETTKATEGNKVVYLNNASGGAVCQGQYFDLGDDLDQMSTCSDYALCFDWASFNRGFPSGRAAESRPALDLTWFNADGDEIGVSHQDLGTATANQDWNNLIWTSVSFEFSLTGTLEPPANSQFVRVNISEAGGYDNGILFDNTSLCVTSVANCVPKFLCDSKLYQTIEVAGDYWLYELQTSPMTHIPLVNLSAAGVVGEINNTSFNKLDGYIYTINIEYPFSLYKIGGDMSIHYLGDISGFPNDAYLNAADFGPDGKIYIRSTFEADIYELDISDVSNLTASLKCDFLTRSGQWNNVGDIAYNPIDGYYYGTRDESTVIIKYDLQTCTEDSILANQYLPSANGAFYIGADGIAYGYQNGDGNLLRIDLMTGMVDTVGTSIPTAQTDGCSCEGIKFLKDVSDLCAEEGSTTTYTYTIYNSWYTSISNVNFRDTLNDGLTWASEPYDITGGTIGPSSITNNSIGNFVVTSLPQGIVTFKIDANIPNGYSGPQPHFSQAYLDGLPGVLAPFKKSDYPLTPEIDDPTPLYISTPVSITGDTEICLDETTSLSPTSGGTWTSNNTGIATVTNSGIVTPIAAGSVSFTFTDGSTDCMTTTANLTVNPKPIVTITGSATICEGETTTLSPSTGGIWVSSNNAIATVTNAGIVTAVSEGTVNFTFTNSTTLCESDPTTDITIIAKTPVSVTGPTSICEGFTSTLSPTSGGTWTSNDVSIATVTNGGVVTGVSEGSTTFIFTNTTTGCVSNATQPITVNDIPTVDISGNSIICIGSTTSLTPNTGGAWISNNAAVATVTNGGIVTAISEGTASFTFTSDASCESDPTELISVTDLDQISNAGTDTQICSLDTVILGGGLNISPINYGILLKATDEPSTSELIEFEKNGLSAPRLLIHIMENPTPVTLYATQKARIESVDVNFSDDKTWVGLDGDNYNRSLLQFDLSSISGTISHAELVLYADVVSGNLDVSVYPVQQDWVEDDTNWDESDNGVAWNTPGVYSTGDYNLDSQTITAEQDYAWDVTNAVVKWMSLYEWSTGDTTSTITVFPETTTTYSLTVTPPNGCSYTDEATITVIPRPAVNIIGASTICVGESTQLSTTGSGGFWTSSDESVAIISSDGVVAGLSGGTVTFTYTSPNGCESFASADVTVSPDLSVDILYSGALCLEDDTELAAVVTGGSPGFTYSWTGPNSFTSTLETINVSESGNYYVTVTDAAGCTGDFSAYVYEAYEPFIFSFNTEVCEGESITLSINSETAVSYNWGPNAGNATTSSVTVTPSPPSTDYTVTVTNNQGCQFVTTTTIDAITQPAVNVTGPASICEGETTTLSPTSGGTWASSNNAIATVTNAGVVTGVSGGTVNFIFTNSTTTCESDATTDITIKPITSVSVTGPTSICEGFTSQLSPTTGGTWTSNDINIATVDNSGLVTGVNPGSTTFIFTNNTTNCTSDATQPITVNEISTVEITGSSILCIGGTTSVEPSSGGTWNSSDTNVATITNGGIISTIGEGTATFTFTSDAGCVTEPTEVINVIDPDEITNAGPDAQICALDTLTLGGGLDISSINYGFLLKATDEPALLDPNDDDDDDDVNHIVFKETGGNAPRLLVHTIENPTPATLYATQTARIEKLNVDHNHVEPRVGFDGEEYDRTLLQFDLSSISGTLTHAELVLRVDEIEGSLDVSVSPIDEDWVALNTNWDDRDTGVPWDSAGVYSSGDYIFDSQNLISEQDYSWDVTEALIKWKSLYEWSTGETTAKIKVAPETNQTYSLTVTPPNGCPYNDETIVTTIPKPSVTISGANEICVGDNTHLSTTGSGGYWASNDASVAVVSSGGVVVGIAPGTVSFTYTSSNGCESYLTGAITVDPSVESAIEFNGSYCLEENSQLSAIATGGTSGFTYSWTGPGGFTSTLQTTDIALDGNYNLTVTDSKGCSSNTTAFVYEAYEPFIFSLNTEVCEGEDITLSVNSNSAATYQWGSNAGNATSQSVNVSPTGPSTTYHVTVTNSIGCTTEATAVIDVNPKPEVTISGSNSICENETTQLTPSSGGTWTSSDYSVATIDNTGLVTGVSIGSATFTFRSDATDCFSDPSEPVTVGNNGTINITGDNQICIDENPTLTASITEGTWSSDNISVAQISAAGVITPNAQGSATITFTPTSEICYSPANYEINIHPTPSLSINGPSTICENEQTYLNASSGGVWTSSDPSVASVTSTGIVTGLSGGSATFSFVSSAGCAKTLATPITVIGNPEVSLNGPSDICINTTTSLLPSSGGIWISSNNNVATINSAGIVTGVNVGTATFTFIESSNGCIADDMITINVNSKPTINGLDENNLCIGETTFITPSSGGTWTSSNTAIATITNSGVITAVGNGSATFKYTNTLTGCISNASMPLTVSNKPVTNFTGPTTICTDETTSISPSSGGIWTSSDVSIATISASGTITGVAPGTVQFIYTNNTTGCISNASEDLTVSDPTPINVTGPTNICVGENTSMSPSTGGTWSSSNSNIAIIANNGIVTGIAPGFVTFTFNNNSGCTSEPSTEITIDAKPNPNFTGPSSVCVGTTTTLSPSSGGTWTSSNAGIATVDNTGLVTGVSGGTATFTFVDATTGCSATTQSNLNVYEKPTISISGDDEICIGGTTNMLPSSGGSWTSSNNSIASISASGLVTGMSAGTVNFTFYESGSGCVSNASDPITVQPKPTASITGDNPICAGETTTLSPSTGGSWISSNTSVATVTDQGVVTGIAQGLAKFTFVSDAGCSSNQSAPLLVYGKPSIVIDGSDLLCTNETGQMSPSSGGTWTSNNPTVATIDNGGVFTAISAGTVRFTFTDSSTGCASVESDEIIVNDVPTIAIIGPSNICTGGTTNLVPTTGGTWESLDPEIATIQNNGEVTGVSAGSTRFLFTNITTGCVSDSSAYITVSPGPDINFIGPQEICIGETTNITPATGGTWISTNNSVATIDSNGIITAISQGSVKFKYTETSTGCVSDLSESLIVHGVPTVTVSGSNVICVDGSTTLSPSTGGTWISLQPAIATVDNSGNVTGVSTGTAFFVYVDDATGCTSNGSLSVTIQNPVDVGITGDSEICVGFGTTLSPSSGGFWTSSNPAIATVNNSGVVVGRAPGVVTFEYVDGTTGCAANGSTDPITVELCTNHDFNVTLVDLEIQGNLNTNDNVPSGTLYSGTITTLLKPVASIPILVVNLDGSYTFITNKPGKYIYSVPVCIPPLVNGCPTTYLEINVVDKIYSQPNPVANLEFATTFANPDPGLPGTPVSIDAVSNDNCVYTAGCELDPTSVIVTEGANNGSTTVDNLGFITYTPDAGYVGKDTIYYSVCVDGSPAVCNTSRQIVTVNDNSALNSIVAVDDFAYTLKETAVIGSVITNDSDPEGHGLSVITQGSEGSPIVTTEGDYYIDSNGNFTFSPATGFAGPTEIIYTLCDDASEPTCSNATLHLLVFDDISIKLRVYLEGALMNNGGAFSSFTGYPLMRDDLRVSPFTGENYIPISDPYTYQHDDFMDTPAMFTKMGPGMIAKNLVIADSAAVFSVTGDNAIVDWVHVELRSKDDYNTTIATRSGLVQRDGDVVDLDGFSDLRFDGVNVDSFYVAVKHRSHLGVMSNKVEYGQLIDFTSLTFPVFNYGTTYDTNLDFTGLSQKANVVSGYNALWAGDFDSNGQIKFTNPNDDVNILFIDVLFSSPEFLINYNNAFGYYTGDFNMNSKAKYTNPDDDINLLFSQILLYPLNLEFLSNFNGIMEQVPD